MKIKNGEFWLGDCLNLMGDIPDGSVDMVLCDLPYEATVFDWDKGINLSELWEHYNRVAKKNAAFVFTSIQPFTTKLICSNMKCFRYSLVWDKVNRITGSLQSNKRPMRSHEDILIFARKQPTYNKQKILKPRLVGSRYLGHGKHVGEGKREDSSYRRGSNGEFVPHNPVSIISIKGNVPFEHGLHPTQKPIELFEYLIKTYSNEGEMILDNCAGSGTTAIAAENLNRRWLCIEKDVGYYEKAIERIKTHVKST